MNAMSEINNFVFFLGKGFDFIGIMVFILHHLFVLGDVVVHVPESHFCLLPLGLDLLLIGEPLVLMEFFLDGGQQFEPIFGRVVFHIFEEESVYHGEG